MNGTMLKGIILGNNSLTGTIPDSWASLAANAVALDLSYNRLWGSLGPSWANATGNASITLNFTRLR